MYFVEKIVDEIQLKGSLPRNFDINSSIFFDIETSGLSPKTSFVFLIGLMFYQNGKFLIRQYFANNKDEELEILENFMQDVTLFDTIYHYNGLSFDIPYINERLINYCIKCQINKEKSFDIYQYIRKSNILVDIENLKLKSVEKYMGIYREDDLSGREIVDYYKEFLNNKDSHFRDRILLHNIEDIINLYRILPIVDSVDISKKEKVNIQVTDFIHSISENEIIINGTVDSNSQNEVLVDSNNFMLTIHKDSTNFELKFNIFEDYLYYRIKDYKNYYYIKDIDSVVHKSLVKFYDYIDKEKATKNNCYTKQLSKYIKLPLSPSNLDIRLLSENKEFEENCILISDIEKIMSKEFLIEILKCR